jgi:pilus assembly protein CpaB
MAALNISPVVRRRLPLIFAIVMGAFAVLMMRGYIDTERAKIVAMEARLKEQFKDPTRVLVAKTDMLEGVMITEEDLDAAMIPEQYVQPYAGRTEADVVGLVTLAPIAKGEQILRNKLRHEGDVASSETLASLTPEGKRAVTIGVDALTGAAGLVRPNDHVDVLWGVKVPGATPQDAQVVFMTIFQDVPVLAVGGQLHTRPTAAGAPVAAPGGASTVTLALDAKDAAFLVFAREQGRLQLNVRRPEDVSDTPVGPANMSAMMEAKLGVKPPPQAPAPHHIELYKGREREVVVIDHPGGGTP